MHHRVETSLACQKLAVRWGFERKNTGNQRLFFAGLRRLAGSGRGVGEAARKNQSRSLLVVAEVAISLLLLIGAGLLIQSFMRLQTVKPGFDAENALAVRLSLPKARYQDRASVTAFCDKLLVRIQALPGVDAVGTVSLLPMSGGGLGAVYFNLAGQTGSPSESHLSQYRLVSPDYFHAMKIPLLQGRAFSTHDNADSIRVVLINQTMARRFWDKGDAVGAQITIDDNNSGPRPVEIVGVVGDVKHFGLEDEPTFDVYVPIAQVHDDGVGLVTNSQYWIVRSKTDSRSLEAAFRQELKAVDRDVPTSSIRTLEDYMSDSIAPRRFILRVLTIFSVAALLLAAMGIYGLVSYAVTQRTAEIGIRLALGATRRNVFGLILSQGLKPVLAGVTLGLLGAFAMTRVIRSLLFAVTPTDAPTFLIVISLLIVVALVAGCLPALRATNLNPLIALRYE